MDRNRASLTARCEWGIRNALFYVAKNKTSVTPDEVLGVAMWMPPQPLSEPESWASSLDLWLLWLKQGFTNLRYGGRGGLRIKRYNVWKAKQAEMQRDIWTDERGYYFCNIVTVLPTAQGRGIGRKLFEVVTKRADDEGKRCYLESSRMDPNVRVYEKMGFKLEREMLCEEGGDVCKVSILFTYLRLYSRLMGYQLFCMIRDPQS